MSSRNRNRPGLLKEEADEERSIWQQIRSDAKRIDSVIPIENPTFTRLAGSLFLFTNSLAETHTIQADSNARWQRMREITATLDTQHATHEETSSELEEELMRLSRESIKLCEEIQSSIGGNSEGDVNSLLGQINLLAALRASSEADIAVSLPMSRAASSSKASRNAKRKTDSASIMSADDRDSTAADSPAAGPSPKVPVPSSTRLKVQNSQSRAGSVPAGREASVKIEDGAESGVETGSKDSRGIITRFSVGTEVLYRKKGPHKDKDSEGEGILCIVTSVIGEGKQRRYEIRDADPDVPAVPYRASLQQMTPIPPEGASLPDLQPKRGVLAMYPATTTFYKAEVVPKKKATENEQGTPDGYVRLKFEGEEEFDKEQEVERRYVLTDWTGK